jgi:hypothetical protein
MGICARYPSGRATDVTEERRQGDTIITTCKTPVGDVYTRDRIHAGRISDGESADRGLIDGGRHRTGHLHAR